ncbi:MAG: prepilin-type N-terminal cleavage/methylation domain-containing protein [Kiritimatiellae bacterium]|nr:prepilin-type N-terminal cleavage/methylation domain-containing protein [Kiritimatiellia bacterium]
MKRRGTSGFTLVELLVVIAMLMLLAGAITSSISSAQKRAKIAQATAEAQEMTNAILAYQHFGDNYQLPIYNNTPATEANMSFILGGETGPNGEKLPVLYNASIKGGQILDPWGHPYYVTIRVGRPIHTETDSSDNLKSYVAFPNFNRRPADN